MRCRHMRVSPPRQDAQKAGGRQVHDPFAMFFGGRQDTSKGQNMNMNMKVPLEDIYNGKTHSVCSPSPLC